MSDNPHIGGVEKLCKCGHPRSEHSVPTGWICLAPYCACPKFEYAQPTPTSPADSDLRGSDCRERQLLAAYARIQTLAEEVEKLDEEVQCALGANGLQFHLMRRLGLECREDEGSVDGRWKNERAETAERERDDAYEAIRLVPLAHALRDDLPAAVNLSADTWQKFWSHSAVVRALAQSGGKTEKGGEG